MMVDRLSKLGLSLATASLAAITPSTAQPGRDSGRVVLVMVPQFIAQADSFTAVDETGRTDWGSDEVRAVFADFNPINERATKEYDNVDSGETIAFIAADRCITPLPNCSQGRETVRFMVSLWEGDWTLTDLSGLSEPELIGAHDLYEDGPGSGADLIGKASVGWPQVQLLGTLPNVGDTVERSVPLHGGTDNSTYRFTYRITRLPDVRKRVVIPVPPRQP